MVFGIPSRWFLEYHPGCFWMRMEGGIQAASATFAELRRD
jgi:hypothetical protein